MKDGSRHHALRRRTALTPLHGFLMADDITYVEAYALCVVLCGEESAADERIVDGLVAEAATATRHDCC
jgi:hypothetical protein